MTTITNPGGNNTKTRMKKFFFGLGIIISFNSFSQIPPKPVADFSFTIDGTCSNKVSFTDLSTVSSGTIVSFHWIAKPGTSMPLCMQSNQNDYYFSNLQNPVINFDKAGGYEVWLVVTTNNNVTDTIRKTVTISSLPFTVDINSGGQALCKNTTRILDAGNPGSTYLWTTGETTQTITVYPNQPYSEFYRVTVSNNNGCVVQSDRLWSTDASIADSIFCSYDKLGSYIEEGWCIPNLTYLWNTGATTSNITTTQSGKYWLTVTNGSCPPQTDTVAVTIQTTVLNLGSDINASCSNSVTLDAGAYPDSYYHWSTGATTQQISVTSSGSYWVRLQNNNCILADTISVFFTDQPVVNLGSDTTTCVGQSITLDAGYPGSTYFWSNGETTQTISVNKSGVFAVAVTNGVCFNTDTVSVTVINTGNSLNVANTTVCPGSSVILDAGASPGATYQWTTGATTQTISVTGGNSFGVAFHHVKVNFPNGCSAETSPKVVTLAKGIGSSRLDTVLACANNITIASIHDFILNDNLGSDVSQLSYLWNNGATTSTINVATPGTYFVKISNGACSITDTIDVKDASCDVWPGDANSNMVANAWDILPIGIGYGTTGTARSGATTNWVGQQAADWSKTFTNGVNYKYADCDGDGTIALADVGAILQNYGMTHAKAGIQAPVSVNAPVLGISFDNDSILVSKTVTAKIYLGAANFPVDSLYGIAFALNYDADLVSSASVDFSSSWLGNGTNSISVSKDIPANGRLEMGISRINQMNISGYGEVATVSFVMEGNIAGKNAKYAGMNVHFSDIQLIDRKEQVLPIQPQSDSIIVWQTTTGIQEGNAMRHMMIAPNPANGHVEISAQGTTIHLLRIVNVLGEVVHTEQNPTGLVKSIIDTQAYPEGIYMVELQTAAGVMKNKLIIKK